MICIKLSDQEHMLYFKICAKQIHLMYLNGHILITQCCIWEQWRTITESRYYGMKVFKSICKKIVTETFLIVGWHLSN